MMGGAGGGGRSGASIDGGGGAEAEAGAAVSSGTATGGAPAASAAIIAFLIFLICSRVACRSTESSSSVNSSRSAPVTAFSLNPGEIEERPRRLRPSQTSSTVHSFTGLPAMIKVLFYL